MADNPPEPAGGFSTHVMDQLQQAAHQVSTPQHGRGRGRGCGGRGQGRGRGPPLPAVPLSHPPAAYPIQSPPLLDAFPPLGSQQATHPPPNDVPLQPMQPPRRQPQPRPSNYQRSADPRDFFNRARGDHHSRQGGNRQFQPTFPIRPMHLQAHDDFRRPSAPHGALYQHNTAAAVNSWTGFSSPGHDLRLQVIAQSDYLNDLQIQARAKYQLKQEESQMKENFRRKLESFFQETLTRNYPTMVASEIRLKCYGSLNNGFGLAECDMDLLLALPKGFTLRGETTRVDDVQASAPTQDEASALSIVAEPVEQNFELGWLLEDALLDAQVGARLLTNTRVPIMKVCEKPDEELLQKMRQYSKESRKPPSPKLPARETSLAKYPPVLDLKAIEHALSDLEESDSAAQISIPGSPHRVNAASIEFSGDHGIKCDINFSNFVALCNTRLLREYCAYDSRVTEVGVFVKTWAKLRDINTPYWGTLSSYGYVLMVLHYLMNVVSPPVIPNLQHLAREDDAWGDQTNIELFEGKYDIRFWMDKDKIASYKSTVPRNQESTGHLIRGFFWYYSAREGFNYKFDTISIRTEGGIIRKQQKGWTEAKWASDNKNVRQRYLLAIEDPFETEHNVARVVGHNGIVAIRDEFRRAWDIISRIGTQAAVSETLLDAVENRGDLLRKDREHHRQKMRQLRQDVEVKEREIRKASQQETGEVQPNGMLHENDLSDSLPSSMRSRQRRSSNTLLTRDVGTFQDKPRQSKHGRPRLVKEDSENEIDAASDADDERPVMTETDISTVTTSDRVAPNEQANGVCKDDEDGPEPFCDPAEILVKNGLDANGNPVAWDLSTQDGRWLHWRDTKIRKRRWRGVAYQPGWAILDKMCPFDPHRPRPENAQERKDAFELMHVWRPPVPLDSAEGITSTDKALRAAIPKSRQVPKRFSRPVPTLQHSGPQQNSSNPDGPVGLPISWDKGTRAGRWLMKRDAYIRLGTFKLPSNPDFVHLNDRFPYDATMSRSQLEKYNEELRIHYRYTIQPVNECDRSDGIRGKDEDAESFVARPFISNELPESAEDPIIAGDEISACSPSQPSSQPPRAEPEFAIDSNLKSTSHTQDQKSQASADGMPDSTFIRSRRLAFFAQQELELRQTEEAYIAQDPASIKGIMKGAGIDTGLSISHRDSAVSAIFPIADASGTLRLSEDYRHQWPYGKRPWTKRIKPRQMPQADGPMSLTESSDDQILGLNERAVRDVDLPYAAEQLAKDQPSESLRPAEAQVPDTLYPGLDNDKRPRDEDPSIMPIPRNYGFEFDTRQLHDLAVIKEGGNGCARDGFQFEIEQDYELGGSGEMAWRQSSGKRYSSNANGNQVYEYGKGDEEGLLGELPDW